MRCSWLPHVRRLGGSPDASASNPSYERRMGVQVRNLVRVGNLDTGQPRPAPSRRRGPVGAGSLRTKAVGGGNAKSFPRCVEGKPGGGKAQEGRGADGTLNRFRSPPHSPRGEKALKSRARRLARVTPQAFRVQRQEGMNGPGNPVRLRARDNPLEGKPWTWLRGETNPQGRWRSKPSRACETPRTERSAGSGIPRMGGRRLLVPR